MGLRRRLAVALVLALGAAGAVVGVTAAAFSFTTQEQIDVDAAPDWTAPTVSSAVIGKSGGGETGYIREGAANTYHVYANASDSGNPAAGVGTVTADVSSISTGQTSVALTAGSYTAFGTSFNYRTASPIAPNNTLSAGSKAYTIGAVDLANPANTMSPSVGGSVTVDNTAPAPSDISTADGGGIPGRPEEGDSVTFTYSEPIDPESILANWDGSATDVVVRIINNASNDRLRVYNSANTAVLPLTDSTISVDLGRTDYVSTGRNFGAGAVKSVMTRSGNSITIVFGTASGAVGTAGGTGTMTWHPVANATDRAGNPMPTATFTETGTADAEF